MTMINYQGMSLVSQAHGASDAPAKPAKNTAHEASKEVPKETPEKDDKKEIHPEKSKKEIQEFDPLSIDENIVKVIQAVSKKEKEINETEKVVEIEEQKKMLDLAHESIAKKIKDLERVKGELQEKQDHLNKDEKKNVHTMAKIYEAMKPAQAADIFNKLELTSLIQIIKHMNQKKASAIIASMEANRARQLTLEILSSKMEENPVVG